MEAGAGGDFVMLGGFFAGCEECEGEWEYEYQTSLGNWQPLDPNNNNPKRKTKFTYYGMSSHHSQDIFRKNILFLSSSERMDRHSNYECKYELLFF